MSPSRTDIGNRTATVGRASAVSTYSPNRLNQYQSRTVAGAVDVLGVANPTQGMTVNGTTAARRGEYFQYALSVVNSTAQYPTITTVSASGAGQTNTGRFFVPAATESFQHDAGGNLTQDGRCVIAFRCPDGRPAQDRQRSKPGRTPLRTRTTGFSRARVGYRFYNANTGRRLNRDPIGEQKPQGTLYYVSLNDPINKCDPDGRETWCPYPPPGHYCDDPKANFGEPPTVSATASCQGVQEVADAVNIFNKAMKNERCAKWFKDHGSYGFNLPINGSSTISVELIGRGV